MVKRADETMNDNDTKKKQNNKTFDAGSKEKFHPNLSNFELVIKNRKLDKEGRITLNGKREISVGSKIGNTLIIEDENISGKHFTIKIDNNDKIIVTDISSTNGIYLKIEGSITLPVGGTILAGKTIFKLEGIRNESGY